MWNMAKNILDWICRIWTPITILWGILSYFDIMPCYQVRLYKTNSITPVYSLFPGQKIRLNFDTHEALSHEDINSIYWSLLKNNQVLYTEEGLEPTITLPPTEGGTYQLQVIAKMIDGSNRSGKTNLHVVRDTPKEVSLPTNTGVEISSDNSSPVLVENIKSKGAEVYSNGKWTKIPTVAKSPNKVTIEVSPKESLSTYNNQMLIRTPGSDSELGSYGAVAVPKESIMSH